MVPIVRFFNVSGLFLFRIRFNEKVLMAVKIMFYIQMGDVGLPHILVGGLRGDKDVFWTSVCLTFSLYTFVLPIGDGGPSDSHLWEESKNSGCRFHRQRGCYGRLSVDLGSGTSLNDP